MYAIIIPTLVLGVTGLVLGVGLGIASRKFAVANDPRVDAIYEEMPKANCGVCGYPGCINYARSIVEQGVGVAACKIGGVKLAERIAQIMGADVETTDNKLLARIHCGGDITANRHKGIYEGINTCGSAALVGGIVKCSYGCLGFGDCVMACSFGAIIPREGMPPVINLDKCRSCGRCVSACPRHLIEMVKPNRDYFVACSSHAKGKKVKEVCDVGCIACGICAKKCNNEENIKLEHNLAKVYGNCENMAENIKACPTGCFQEWTK